MAHCTPHPDRTRRSGPPVAALGAPERGATMLEFALVAVVLFTLIFGVIEGGLLVRAGSAINGAADEGARRGAVAANAVDADWQVLQQIKVRGTERSATIDQIVIYNAGDATEGPPQACLDGTPITDICNVYTRADLELPAADLPPCSWCPTSRDASLDEFDYIGVWVDGTYNGVFGVFNNVDTSSYSVLPLEVKGGRPR